MGWKKTDILKLFFRTGSSSYQLLIDNQLAVGLLPLFCFPA